ncbi:DUF4403 family protein [Anditalea andensis]|uniref:DUF4403 family protein n=1 Tax=Anditalea andensis TaxID=1048983 RepID=A0A074KTK8_9BACT|nr:DUF4403 family protein [Anditalea andensis]KEO73301.1 hypothetical protein EL17_13205 [Anditalea andensis]
MKKILIALVFISAFASCKKINPDKPKFSGDPIELPSATSSINFPLEISFQQLEKNLNKEFQGLLFEEKDLSVGSGLNTDLQVTKMGDAKLSSKGDHALKLQIPLRLKGSLKVEKKLLGQLISTAIPYDEVLNPEISFTPVIGENYDLSFQNITIDGWGRSMRYEFLGYAIDFDPLIRKHLQNMLNTQLNNSNFKGLSFRSFMEDAWKNFSQPVRFAQSGIDGYVFTRPHTVKVGNISTVNNKLSLNLGLEGEVISEVGKSPSVRPVVLPKISPNDNTQNLIDITLPLRVGYEAIDQYLNAELVGEPITIDKSTQLIPRGFSSQSFGDRALVKMNFTAKRSGKKDINGDIYLVGKPAYDPQKQAIYFEDIDFDLNTKNVLANYAGWLKQGQILTQMKKRAYYPIGAYLDEAKSEIQKHNQIQTDFASIFIKNPKLDVLGIYATQQDIRLYLNSTGRLDVRINDL